MANPFNQNPSGDQPNMSNMMPRIPGSMPNIIGSGQGQQMNSPIQSMYGQSNPNLNPNQIIMPTSQSQSSLGPSMVGYQTFNAQGQMMPGILPGNMGIPLQQPQISPHSQQASVHNIPITSPLINPVNQYAIPQPSISTNHRSNQTQEDDIGIFPQKLGLINILKLSRISPISFNRAIINFQDESKVIISDDAKSLLALALKSRMIDVVKQTVINSQKRQLTFMPSNPLYIDFPIRQFAQLEIERKILASNPEFKPLKAITPASLNFGSFLLGFQAQPSSTLSFIQPSDAEKRASTNQAELSYSNQDENEIETQVQSRPASTAKNNVIHLYEKFRNDAIRGVAARTSGTTRERWMALTREDINENIDGINQAPLKNVLPSIPKNEGLVIEDVYQFVEGDSAIQRDDLKTPIYNLQYRKVDFMMPDDEDEEQEPQPDPDPSQFPEFFGQRNEPDNQESKHNEFFDFF